MVSRDDLSKTVSKASEECFEYECTPCANDRKSTEAVKCCLNCGEYFCSLCLKHHDRYTNHHKTAEPTAMTRPSGLSRHVVMETCHLHNGNTIDTYCVIHDAVCCSTCVSLKHKTCEGMAYIIDASKGVFEREEFKDIPRMLDDLMARIETLKKVKQDDQHDLQKEKNACLQLIDETRRSINNRLDDIETTAKDSVISNYVEIEDKINQDVDDLNKMEVDIKTSKDNFENTDSDNESQAFARLKISGLHRKVGEDLLRKIKSKPKRGFLKFEINSEFRDFLRSVESMGRPFVNDADENLLTASLIGKHNVRIKSDTTVCRLASFILLPDGKALISDSGNNKIKKFNKSYEVLDWCDMPGQTCGMTNISAGEVAIAIVEKEVIQFVTHNTKLRKERSFKVGNRCRDVAFHDDMLYVTSGGGSNTSCSGHVAVYSLAGQLISRFSNDENGKPIFNTPLRINISSHSPVIHVTDYVNGVVSLDLQGKYKLLFTDKDLQSATGLCHANDGQLIVCGFRSNNVIQIGKKGNMIGVILKKSDPRCLYFDHKESNLYVLMETSDVFHVYHLTT